jgi:signal transduction histidine kinase
MGQLDAEQRELLAGLRSSAAGLKTLLDRLLDYSNIDGGSTRLQSETFVWQDLLDRLRSRYAAEAGAAGQQLVLILDPSMPQTAQGDASRILQLLDELLTNALRAATSGDIILTVRTSPGGTELEVTDNGPGIEAERLPTLVELFADPAGGEGHGLGLPLVAALSRAMGGRLAITSVPGNTLVRVWLPAGQLSSAA